MGLHVRAKATEKEKADGEGINHAPLTISNPTQEIWPHALTDLELGHNAQMLGDDCQIRIMLKMLWHDKRLALVLVLRMDQCQAERKLSLI